MRTYGFLGLAAVLLWASLAHGATTGSLTISGSVPKQVSITVTGQGNYNALDLSQSATDLVVAVVNETSNDQSGYQVSLASANAGQLKKGTDAFAYTAKYDGTAVTLSATPQTVTNVTTQNGVVNVNKNLTITYTGTTNKLSGNYTDTLTFTVSAN